MLEEFPWLIDGEEMSSSKGYGESMNRYQRHRNFSGLIFDIKNVFVQILLEELFCKNFKMYLSKLNMSSSKGWDESLPKARELLQPHLLRFSLASCKAQ